MSAKYTQLAKGTAVGKKFKIVFYDNMRNKIKTIQFGAEGYTDFTRGATLQQKMHYLQRHENENWSDYMTAGACSRWILWNLKSVSASYKNYRDKFKLEMY